LPPSSSKKEKVDANAFFSFFQEINDKAQEALQRSQPEPERALEFFKQAEEFLKQIEKSKKHK